MGRRTYSGRLTAEECKSISTKALKAGRYFDGGVRSGGIRWNRLGEKIGNIDFVVSTVPGDEYIRFIYMQTERCSEETTKLDYKVRIESTACNFGGRRWWFICPLMIGSSVCNRRVGALYLANSKYFGCRHCYNLTYESCKTHDNRFSAILSNPDLLKAMIDSKDPAKALLASKALLEMF